MVIFRPGRKKIPKRFEKVMVMCYIHMCIHAEFKIINMLLKERRSKYKPANALNTRSANFSRCK